LPVYSLAGALVQDGDHGDFVQFYSRPDAPPVADIVIRGNRMTGSGQCVFGGNHVRPWPAPNGPMTDDGGFDRIVVEGNTCRNSAMGFRLMAARNSVIRG